ncbi:MAG: DUF4235 domain-containing protein [Actinomycetota bacterium]|nr:DUF4235 domain-containing protein [Actinomycetota bacterium]
MSSFDRVPYEVLSLASGILGGALAGAVVTRVWRAVAGEDEAPEPTALNRNIREVLVAGALQGVIFGVAKAAVSRLTARGYRRLAGHELRR